MSNDLSETNILLRIIETRGNSFYRVLVDKDETPYIDIEELLNQYLDFTSVSCEVERLFCQGEKQPEKRVFWIDGMEWELGDSERSPSSEPFPSGSLVFQNGRLYLRYDIWGKWLPVSVNWNRDQYFLSITPDFLLLSARESERALRKKYEIMKREENERLKEIKPIFPSESFRAQGRYLIGVERPAKDTKDYSFDFDYNDIRSRLNLDINLDFFRGTFRSAGDIMYDKDGPSMPTPPFWTFTKKETMGFHLMEIGNTRMERSSVLVPASVLRNGFRLGKKERLVGAGTIDISGQTQSQTEIDIYKNGILIESTVTGFDGIYEFKNFFVSGGDSINIWFYHPDGTQEEKVMRVAEDDGLILSAKEWDLQLETGANSKYGFTEYESISHLGLRYGFFENFSTGIHTFLLPDKANYNPDNRKPFMIQKPSFMMDTVFRPVPGLNLFGEFYYEGLDDRSRFDVGGGTNISLFQHHFIELEYSHVDSGSVLLFRQNHPGSTGRLKHNAQYLPWRFEENILLRKDTTTLDLKITRQIWSRLYSFIDSSLTWPELFSGVYEPATYQLKSGANISLIKSIEFELSRSWLHGASTSFIFRFTGGKQNDRINPWNISSGFTVSDEGEVYCLASVIWRVSPEILIGLSLQNASIGFQLFWSDIVSGKPGPAHWNEFENGTVSGRIIPPKETKGQPFPLDDIRVVAGSSIAVTDKSGFYILRNVPVGSRVMVKVDAGSLDVSVAPEKEFEVVWLRPGTHIEINFNLVSSAGLDGRLVFKGNMPPDVIIVVKKVPAGNIVTTVKPEYDGFFIIENLTSGRYMLELDGLKSPSHPVFIEIHEGEDWLSGLIWEWD